MTKDDARTLALEVLRKAIRDLEAARIEIQVSGCGSVAQYRLGDAVRDLRDLEGPIANG